MKTVNVYEFNELSAEAKEKAIKHVRDSDNYPACMDSYISDGAITIKTAVKEFGCVLKDWSIGSDVYRSYIRVEIRGMENEEIDGIRLRTWLLNNHYDVFYKRQPYGKYQKRPNGKWLYDRYSKIQYVETDCPFTGMTYDCDFLEPFRQFITKPDGRTFEDLIKEGAHRVCKSLESEQEYWCSDEGVISEIESRDWYFLEDGTIFEH